MTDRETLDRARLLFVGDTQGDKPGNVRAAT